MKHPSAPDPCSFAKEYPDYVSDFVNVSGVNGNIHEPTITQIMFSNLQSLSNNNNSFGNARYEVSIPPEIKTAADFYFAIFTPTTGGKRYFEKYYIQAKISTKKNNLWHYKELNHEVQIWGPKRKKLGKKLQLDRLINYCNLGGYTPLYLFYHSLNCIHDHITMGNKIEGVNFAYAHNVHQEYYSSGGPTAPGISSRLVSIYLPFFNPLTDLLCPSGKLVKHVTTGPGSIPVIHKGLIRPQRKSRPSRSLRCQHSKRQPVIFNLKFKSSDSCIKFCLQLERSTPASSEH